MVWNRKKNSSMFCLDEQRELGGFSFVLSARIDLAARMLQMTSVECDETEVITAFHTEKFNSFHTFLSKGIVLFVQVTVVVWKVKRMPTESASALSFLF
ncbi:hypothetical protein AVEN_118271-1 [Araneus ventricosus]|uniref:Uncharacterized protein n=1 Tax=Araneus ventricosus TaxID=182803 RepID=A0A4Y2E132_ARAVE|nr:hypothetical protein AVEN_118271-1 [Araneus ventricosus]